MSSNYQYIIDYQYHCIFWQDYIQHKVPSTMTEYNSLFAIHKLDIYR